MKHRIRKICHLNYNGTYQGKPYRFVVLKRVVLYPQKPGKLEIEPLSLEVFVDVPTNRRDFFGGRIYTQTTKTVSAGRRTINVKALPEKGKPENFSGAVGNFKFVVTTSKEDLKASESLQAMVKVSGKGNLKLFQLPEPNFPSALEVYEPEFDENVKTTLAGMQGEDQNYIKMLIKVVRWEADRTFLFYRVMRVKRSVVFLARKNGNSGAKKLAQQ